ncbi:MAG: DUF6491 family protein [Pseudomonadota bacterium]|nr:DUF6491 family protein [Pseudomonadota bacterium]
MRSMALLGAISALGATYALAAPTERAWPELGVETEIMWPQRNIRNFEADEERGVWLEDQQRRWYYARVTGICPGLKFAQGIGFDTRGSSRFNRSSLIVVEGDLCALESLVTAVKPLPRKQREKANKP